MKVYAIFKKKYDSYGSYEWDFVKLYKEKSDAEYYVSLDKETDTDGSTLYLICEEEVN